MTALGGIEEACREISVRLRDRSRQIEETILLRVDGIAQSPADPEYAAGLRDAVTEAVDFALAELEGGERSPGAIPTAVTAQARRAARTGTALETALRRCHAGDRLFTEFIIGAAQDLPGEALKEILRSQSLLADRLMATIAAAYVQEVEDMQRSPALRFGARVRRLLAGDRDSDPEVDYDFDAWHVAMIVSGASAEGVVRLLAKKLGCQVLFSQAGVDDVMWAWIGRQADLAIPEIEDLLVKKNLPADLSLALGEPRRGIDGWRLSHREAQAALQVMVRRPKRVTRCRDVILVSAVMQDQLLARSLVQTYLVPLNGRGNTGEVLRETLSAYFDANQNAATTAAALGVARHTVERRLRNVEAKVGQTLDRCGAQIQVALGIESVAPSSGASGRARRA